MKGVSVKNTISNEEESNNIIRFEDADKFRWYEQDGIKYISVTQVLDVAQHFKLTNWFKNNSKNKIEKTKKETANLGTQLHSLVERDLNETFSEKDLFDLESVMVNPFKNWRDVKHKYHIKSLATEMMLVSKRYGFAGQMDMLIEGKFKKPINVADLKTGFYPIKAGWQMAAYREAAIENIDMCKPDNTGMVGIQVHRDGSKVGVFEYEHYSACFEAFLHCLEIFKMLYFNKLNKMDWPYLKNNSFKEWWGVR